ncbi:MULTISPECIES: sulfate ABC transporter permease subunit CysW [Gordonia]|uniref:Sulfate ABC transporter permease subunit CysW n=3 Tax=Gordonia TaxID=2053 RepID=A0AAW4G4V7_GORRU|nr:MULTISPECIES: sulfate ABC transporter permease subunit CysW [Gordonia]ASR04082.1 Sulfate transport system permease protein CysW [Gordonia rubripertincta]MBM7278329.1 sulfate ABC transporter permease subunit CysW [Gordonia rubripertincta]MDG6779515.1 sulfate ABC transporter permease subunit CysW [Gordonia rubripertincta]NKY62821.1 sulfate ABC transporter permease subunit CysW [Gordonia rubripertincta]QMU19067.1 sulfate ABC transporter permease subunit CysW [Gordonia rubripertincta]
MKVAPLTKYGLRTVALVYLLILLVVPVGTIFYRSFEHGLGQFWEWITTPAAISALQLSLLIVAIVVPLNVIFGVITALALARGRFPGKGLLQSVVDLPFAVSPVVAGVALILLWGYGGWFGGIESLGFRIIFGFPGLVLATLFVTLPFVAREVEPVLREIGTEQEEAAATLGASNWQVFWRVTLPAIRWGLTYGIVLTVARALGEYGAVTMVSSNYPGVSQTLTLLVHSRYTDDYNEFGAYAAATLLMFVAILVLVLMSLIERRAKSRLVDAGESASGDVELTEVDLTPPHGPESVDAKQIVHPDAQYKEGV